MLQTALCGEACMAWAPDGLAAAMLLLCHISRDGLIIAHILNGVLVRIWLFFRAVLCLWKSGNKYLSRDLFLVNLANKAQLSRRKHCCGILGTEYIWFLRDSVVAFLIRNITLMNNHMVWNNSVYSGLVFFLLHLSGHLINYQLLEKVSVQITWESCAHGMKYSTLRWCYVPISISAAFCVLQLCIEDLWRVRLAWERWSGVFCKALLVSSAMRLRSARGTL